MFVTKQKKIHSIEVSRGFKAAGSCSFNLLGDYKSNYCKLNNNKSNERLFFGEM